MKVAILEAKSVKEVENSTFGKLTDHPKERGKEDNEWVSVAFGLDVWRGVHGGRSEERGSLALLGEEQAKSDRIIRGESTFKWLGTFVVIVSRTSNTSVRSRDSERRGERARRAFWQQEVVGVQKGRSARTLRREVDALLPREQTGRTRACWTDFISSHHPLWPTTTLHSPLAARLRPTRAPFPAGAADLRSLLASA